LLITAALLAAATVAAAFGLRLLVIEPPQFAWTCQGSEPPWWCVLRAAAIFGLRAGLIGFIGLGAGIFALWRCSGSAALLAVGAGAAGLVLYAPEPAAGGALLGALALVRR
jgi:hypothetical protein